MRSTTIAAREYIHGREQCLVTDPSDDGTYAMWDTEEQCYLRRGMARQEARVVALNMPYVTPAGARWLDVPVTA